MTDREDRSDAALLRSDDARDFAAFYRRHVDAVLRLCARRDLSPEDAADITADVFLTALQRRARFDHRRGTGRSWLLGISEHKISDVHRRSVRRRSAERHLANGSIELTERDLSDYATMRAAASDALRLIAGLPADQRAAVESRVLGDDSYGSMSQRSTTSPAVLRQRVSRGLATIRRQLKEQQ